MQDACWGAKSLPVPWSLARVGFCGGRTGVRTISPEQVQRRFANSLFWICSVAVSGFHRRLHVGPWLWELWLRPLNAVIHGVTLFHIFSQLKMNITLLFFAKKSSSSGVPYMLFVRHNFFSHPNPLQWFLTLPEVNQSVTVYGAAKGRCDTTLHAKKVKKQDH